MSRQLDGKLLRLALNTGSYARITDQITGAPAKMPICDVRVEIGIFYYPVNADPVLMDLTGITSITATIKALVNGGAPSANAPAVIPEKTVLAANFDDSLTTDTWDDLSKSHAVFQFPEAETAGLTAGDYWLVFTALLANGKTVPLAFGKITVVEDGAGLGGVPPDPVVNYYTAAQADTRFVAMRLGITARSGGGVAAIDGIATAGGAYPADTAILTRTGANGGAELWMLAAGADAEDAAHGVVRPDDFDAATNALVWKQLL